MSKFVDFANEWVARNEQGHTPSCGFDRMLRNAKLVNVNADIDQLAELYYAATKKSAYVATAGMDSHTTATVKQFIEWFDNGLTHTPAPLADVLGCEWDLRDPTPALIRPDGEKLHPRYSSYANPVSALQRFRDLLADAAEAGIIRKQPVKVCGRVALYLYSL